MQCSYFDAGTCASCSWLPQAYADQVAAKQHHSESLLPPTDWLPAVPSAEVGFRNKAKLVIGGGPGAVTVGILDGNQRGVDLRECGLYEPGLAHAVRAVADLVDQVRLLPYDVPKRRGELKHVLLTHSPNGELMVRFVLRSLQQAARITPEAVRAFLPQARVITLNVQPDHKAVLEGPTEIVVSEQDHLLMRLDKPLWLGPRSFFQTNTAVAQELYRQARRWAERLSPAFVVDAYCGVGGFALHVATPGREVVGIDTQPGRDTAGVRFIQGDVITTTRDLPSPDLVILNPPRRGVGALTEWIQRTRPAHVIYSSCNPASLAGDLARLPGYAVLEARVFDMFPHTSHQEVMVLLETMAS